VLVQVAALAARADDGVGAGQAEALIGFEDVGDVGAPEAGLVQELGDYVGVLDRLAGAGALLWGSRQQMFRLHGDEART
jgi:hypothetical protein